MSDQASDGPTFSFVVPLHDEQEVLEQFHARLSAVAAALGEPYEIVFVNDGSSDGTADVLAGLAADDPHVKVVELSRNFGHQVALTAGCDLASGRAVICLDGDCQHPPELVPELVARWREGFEVVGTLRKDRKGVAAGRRTLRRLMRRLAEAASGAKLSEQTDFRLLDRKVVLALRAHRERARFLSGLIDSLGFRRTVIPFVAEKRAAGRSSGAAGQVAGMAAAGALNFSVRPLRLPLVAGAALVGGAAVYAIVALVLWPFGAAPGVLTHMVVAALGLFGVQLVMLGVMGEYIGRIFEEAKGRPLYVIRQTVGFEAERTPPEPEPEARTGQPEGQMTVWT